MENDLLVIKFKVFGLWNNIFYVFNENVLVYWGICGFCIL